MGPERDEMVLPPAESTIRSRLFNVFELTMLFVGAAVGAIEAAAMALTVQQQAREQDFQGDCPLFAQVDWYNRVWFQIDVNPSSLICDFCIILQIFLSMAALFIVVLRIAIICTRLVKPAIRYRIRILFMIPFFAVASFAVLVQATLHTAGLNTFCRGLMDGAVDEIRCWMMQPIDWYVYDGTFFYNRLFNGMVASWCSFFIWAVLTTASCLVALFSRTPLNQ